MLFLLKNLSVVTCWNRTSIFHKARILTTFIGISCGNDIQMWNHFAVVLFSKNFFFSLMLMMEVRSCDPALCPSLLWLYTYVLIIIELGLMHEKKTCQLYSYLAFSFNIATCFFPSVMFWPGSQQVLSKQETMPDAISHMDFTQLHFKLR